MRPRTARTHTHAATPQRTTPAHQPHRDEAPHSAHTHTRAKEKGTPGPTATSGERAPTTTTSGPQPGMAGNHAHGHRPGVARGHPAGGEPGPGVAGHRNQNPQAAVARDQRPPQNGRAQPGTYDFTGQNVTLLKKYPKSNFFDHDSRFLDSGPEKRVGPHENIFKGLIHPFLPKNGPGGGGAFTTFHQTWH